MPVLFVHGVPDTPHLWHRVLDRLSRGDVETLALPGFGGAPLPEGFVPTKEAYADWLVARILERGGPVDLVGHDWGGMLALRAASLAPARVRSLAAGGSPVDPDYTWHDMARTWQTPGAGEQVMESLTCEALGAALCAAGVPEDDAGPAAARVDGTMKRCILQLYRSATEVGAQWGPELDHIRARSVLIWGEADPYAPATTGRRMAEQLGADWVPLSGCGHWWPLERPEETAAALEALWSRRP